MRLALVTLLAVTLTACGVDERLADAYGLCDELHPDEPAFHADCRKFWEELLECTFDRRVELSVRKYTDYCGALADARADGYRTELTARGEAARIEHERQICADYDLTWTPQGCE